MELFKNFAMLPFTALQKFLPENLMKTKDIAVYAKLDN